MAVLYAGSIVCWAAAARFFGPGRQSRWRWLFSPHGLRPDVPRAVERQYAFLLGRYWGLLVVRASFGPTVGRFALVGLGVALLALVRPGNTVLLAFGIVPLLVAGAWRARLRRTAAFAVAALLPLAAWSVHNGVRFDYWGLARGGNAVVPFYRAFITDHIISPENGEDSRRLATAMQRHLLTREPYRSYGVTLDQLFRDGSFRVHEDLYLLSDQVFGWGSDYDVLRGAGVEGVRAHPGRYARGVSRTIWDELAKAQFRVASAKRAVGGTASSKPATVVIGGKRLPEPSEGELIRQARSCGSLGRTEHPAGLDVADGWHFEFDHPGIARVSSRSRGRQPVRRSPQPHRKRATRARLNHLALVPAAVDVDSARPGRRRRVDHAAGRCWSRCRSQRSPSCS
jgi:hypothetical protein